MHGALGRVRGACRGVCRVVRGGVRVLAGRVHGACAGVGRVRGGTDGREAAASAASGAVGEGQLPRDDASEGQRRLQKKRVEVKVEVCEGQRRLEGGEGGCV